MQASQNPFVILNASTLDNEARLHDLAVEAASHGHGDAAIHALNILSDPQTRLAAEVAWFPGTATEHVSQTLAQVAHGELPSLQRFNALSRANFFVESLAHLSNLSAQATKNTVEVFASHIQAIDSEDVLLSINHDREAAGLPLVPGLSLIDAELHERLAHYKRTTTSLLDRLPSGDMVEVYTRLAWLNTYGGKDVGHRLIRALLGTYDENVREFLTAEGNRAIEEIDTVGVSSDTPVSAEQIRNGVNDVIDMLRAWVKVARPVQLAHKSFESSHEQSERLAFIARGLALHLVNAHGYLDEARRLCMALRELFSDVATVAEKIDQDIADLRDISRERGEPVDQEAGSATGRADEAVYETDLGVFFKDTLRLSNEWISYKGTLTPLDQITGVKWGAIEQVAVGMEYFFAYRTWTTSVLLKPSREQFAAIVDRTWGTVCIPILRGWLDAWRKGETVRIAGVDVSDGGVVVTRSHLLLDDETRYLSWSEVTKVVRKGSMIFQGNVDQKYAARFTYMDDWNVGILEFAIDKVIERKMSRLSELLEG